MKGWREHAADIFAKHGEIASKMKFAPEPDPSDLRLGIGHAWYHVVKARVEAMFPATFPAW